MMYSGVNVAVLISENSSVCAKEWRCVNERSKVNEGEVRTGKWMVNSGAGIHPYGRQCSRAEELFL